MHRPLLPFLCSSVPVPYFYLLCQFFFFGGGGVDSHFSISVLSEEVQLPHCCSIKTARIYSRKAASYFKTTPVHCSFSLLTLFANFQPSAGMYLRHESKNSPRHSFICCKNADSPSPHYNVWWGGGFVS